MGRASTRAAIAAYFTPATVSGLTTTYRSRPKEIPAQAFGLGLSGGSGAVLIVHLADDDETTLVMVGTSPAGKQSYHHVAMEILFQSNKADAQAAMDDHDALIDNLMTHFRADRQFGTGGSPIWEAGPNPEGIKVELTEPVLGKQNVMVNTVIRYVAIEMAPA